jgi:hypothetical protein
MWAICHHFFFFYLDNFHVGVRCKTQQREVKGIKYWPNWKYVNYLSPFLTKQLLYCEKFRYIKWERSICLSSLYIYTLSASLDES